MTASDLSDIQALEDAFKAAQEDARTLVDGMTEEVGTWRAAPASWSVAECLDHLATGNKVYLLAMEPAAAGALRNNRRRRRSAQPGLIGGWFVRTLEAPVNPRFKMKAPRAIRPRVSPSLQDACAQFLESQEQVRTFLRKYAEIDLAGVRFRNPFIRGVRFSLATGLHVLAAHEHRHLRQAWRTRQEAEQRTQHRAFTGA